MESSSPDGKWGRRAQTLLGWLMYAAAGVVACVVVAAAAIWLILPRPIGPTPLEGRLLSAGPEPTLFSTVLPDLEWDTVCYLAPYEKPSQRLPLFVKKDLKGFTYEPSDRYITEQINGLAFVNYLSKTIYIFEMDSISNGGDLSNTIYSISGPRCLKKDWASFIIEHVDRPNISYTQLVFVSAK